MRLIVLIVLVIVCGAARGQARLSHLDYIRCTAHIEQASQKLLFGDIPEADIAAAMRCKPLPEDTPRTIGLTAPQLTQFGKVTGLFAIQVRAPTPNVHMKLVDEIATFVDMLD